MLSCLVNKAIKQLSPHEIKKQNKPNRAKTELTEQRFTADLVI